MKKIRQRYLKSSVEEDLKVRMVFIGGPRQVGKTTFAVECKTGEKDISPALFYFKERTTIPKCYQVHTGTRDFEKRGIRVLPFFAFCRETSMP